MCWLAYYNVINPIFTDPKGPGGRISTMVPNIRPFIAGLLGLLMLLALSCGGGANPFAPGSGPDGNGMGLTSGNDPDGSSSGHQAQAAQSAGLWGIYDITYDADSDMFEIVPMRTAQFTFNMTGFMQPPDGSLANLGIKIIDKTELPQGRLTLDVSITHPMDIPRLVGFDTYGTLIGNGSYQFDQDQEAVFAGDNDLKLLNFDGYTRWMNPYEFSTPGYNGFLEGALGTKDVDWTATVNGYKYFADGLSATGNLTNYLKGAIATLNRGAFLPGTTNTRRYYIQFPMDPGPKIKFQYAIISHFRAAKDANGDPIPEPAITDFPITANALEAFYITADTSESTLLYNEPQGFGGGVLKLKLEIFDWQGMEDYGGQGVFNEISAIGFGSPNGLFGSGGLTIAITDSAIQENDTTSPHSTELDITIQNLEPQTWGLHEIVIAVYSAFPTNYGPGFGAAYPASAKLAGFTRVDVDVIHDTEPGNHAPVITEIQGLTDVNCWSTAEVYTCIADDVDPGDTIQYQWEVALPGIIPTFALPPSYDNTATVDWSSPNFIPGKWHLWFKVTDNDGMSDRDYLEVTISPDAIIADPISADPDDIFDVECTNSDAVYSVDAVSCYGGTDFFYRWLRGAGTPPDPPNPADPNWSFPSLDNFIVYDWGGTQTGNWWVVAEVSSVMDGKGYSDFLTITRIDTAPSAINPPTGETDVNCNNSAEVYLLMGGDDCDGGANQRQWAITGTNNPPAAGWLPALLDQFTVNWSVFPLGTYYAWQRIGSGTNWTVSTSLEIVRGNTPPETPPVPQGPALVTCLTTNALYTAGAVDDCEDDPVLRQWALSTSPAPPVSGWTSFTGNSFTINFSGIQTNLYGLWQRVSDNGSVWVNSAQGAMVNKFNSPPEMPDPITGPDEVTCNDVDVEYEAGAVSDCDFGDVLTRFYMVSTNPGFPVGDWVEFTGDSFFIDWSEYESVPYFLFQKVSDGIAENVLTDPLPVTKSNAPPVVGPVTGASTVDCTSDAEEYSETGVSDCDLGSILAKWYYISTSSTDQTGGNWIPYFGSSFTVNFAFKASGEYWIFLRVSDGHDETISSPFHVTRINTPPEKPSVPSGPGEVTCENNPELYNPGFAQDCDVFDELTRYYYISTNEETPTGGTWVQFLGLTMLVDFTGVTAEQQLYLFQKVSDGSAQTVSDSLPVIYHNTLPDDPMHPTGLTNVNCANDNEVYQAGPDSDCDSWQTLSRSWAVNTIDWPPAIGWTAFTGSDFTIDWSGYSQGTYYLFQRVTDGFGFAYSASTTITVGPPVLVKPPTVTGNADPVCDGPVETYDAGSYMAGCTSVTITRSYAFSNVPSPPLDGWTVFSGTTFDVDPSTLTIGYHYLFQKAVLDAQSQTSDAFLVTVHPGELGVPDVPSGAATVDCLSDSEDYEMGTVTTACPGTTVIRSWQIRETDGTPVTAWISFSGQVVTIDWTDIPPDATYHLVQKADDGDHVTESDPLIVAFTNSDPEFLGTITGATSVDCSNIHEEYDGGEVSDCDTTQDLTREWAWNTIDTYPVTGWTLMTGSTFIVDYSDPEIQPGDVYLFQRVSDGVTIVYDPVSLHVVYTNTPPDEPIPPIGTQDIYCTNLQQSYFAGSVSDCDGNTPTREWAIGPAATPPGSGWVTFTGFNFNVDWTSYDFGDWYLYQRASDGIATSYSAGLLVTKHNSAPEVTLFTCDQGAGPFNTDGQTSGLTGLSLVTELDFTIDVDDCDGETVTNYWAVNASPTPPSEGDPSWNLINGTAFSVDLADYTGLAPAALYVHLGSSDGTNWASTFWVGTLSMWDYVWLTQFSAGGDMWAEDACVSGAGSYTWSYDAGGYLRLTSYGSGSVSAVWGSEFAMPAAPGGSNVGKLYAYVNPALATPLDNAFFSMLNQASCVDYDFSLITGSGCSANSPTLKTYTIPSGAPVWNTNRMLGIYENGLAGCGTSEFLVDWAGIWIQPS